MFDAPRALLFQAWTDKMLFASVAVRDAMLKFQMAEGWSQSLESLEEFLAKS
jgi:uncharacterized protein YndB with AHSA1/START domain